MIKKNTVFVLGAGASIPYGFPSGAGLRSEICHGAVDGGWLPRKLHQYLSISEATTKDFAQAFLRSNIPSIDAFLLNRQDYLEIGKFSIAAVLMSRERSESLSSEGVKDHWYRYLWHSMCMGVDSIDALGGNNVRFLTFNYDRSLECFFYESIKNAFGVDADKALSVCESIQIQHLYGRLGRFHYQVEEGSRPYANALSEEGIKTAAAGIELIQQARDDSKNFELARSWFSWAQRIYFLGFGFDETNCLRLGLPFVLKEKLRWKAELPVITASVYGLTKPEQNKAKSLITLDENGWNPMPDENLQALRGMVLLE